MNLTAKQTLYLYDVVCNVYMETVFGLNFMGFSKVCIIRIGHLDNFFGTGRDKVQNVLSGFISNLKIMKREME